jgi:predicted dienelactone hydrolase
MKRSGIRTTFSFLAVLSAATVASAQSANVGFAEVRVANGTEPPLAAGIWYPTDAEPSVQPLELFEQVVALNAPVKGDSLPLVVISHGGGGSFASHYDTALALARAGFVAAAISHTGDTYDDQRKVLQLWLRPEQLRVLISYMLHDWPQHERLDGKRIGAFGFSNGGFTVLVAAGGVPDLAKVDPFCNAHRSQDLCRALTTAGFDPSHLGDNVPSRAWIADPRIKAAVIAAPAFAFTFTRDRLKNIHIPIQLWRAANDHHQPSPYYEEYLRQRLAHAPVYHVVPVQDIMIFCRPAVRGWLLRILLFVLTRPALIDLRFTKNSTATLCGFSGQCWAFAVTVVKRMPRQILVLSAPSNLGLRPPAPGVGPGGEIVRTLGGNVRPTGRFYELEHAAISLLSHANPRILIIDKIQHLLSCSAREQRAALNMVKFLSNDRRISVVAAGTCGLPEWLSILPKWMSESTKLPGAPSDEWLSLPIPRNSRRQNANYWQSQNPSGRSPSAKKE